MVVQIEAAEAAKKEAQKAKKVASKKGGRGGGGCRNSSSQVSCDWLAPGHVTPSSPLIGRAQSQSGSRARSRRREYGDTRERGGTIVSRVSSKSVGDGSVAVSINITLVNYN